MKIHFNADIPKSISIGLIVNINLIQMAMDPLNNFSSYHFSLLLFRLSKKIKIN